MWKWIQEWTGDENFADIVVCHVSFIELMPMQLLLIIFCYFLFEIFMRDKSGGGGWGGVHNQQQTPECLWGRVPADDI